MDLISDVHLALQRMAEMRDMIRDTHGNVSQTDGTLIAIKPSGVPYDKISLLDVSLVNPYGVLRDGLRPSVDLPHHMSIYYRHPWIRGICHIHSPYVTAFAIAQTDIECCSTEQADVFGHSIRCLPFADLDEWGDNVMLDASEKAVLLGHHGALTFGKDAMEAVDLAVSLENVAQKMHLAISLGPVEKFSNETVRRWHVRYRSSYGQR